MKSSGSNGIVERSAQGLEGQIRVLYLALQERLGRKIAAGSWIVAFIPESAAYLMNRLEVGKDGKTAYERVKGKKPTVLGIEFGEKLLYKVKPGSKVEKLMPYMNMGFLLVSGGGVGNFGLPHRIKLCLRDLSEGFLLSIDGAQTI